MQRTVKTAVAVAITAAIGFASVLRADEPKPTKLTLHPMAAPTPALKYRLLPPANEQISGNAAVPYGKVTAEEMNYFKIFVYNDDDKIDAWQDMPLDKLRREKTTLPTSSIFFLEQGAKCKYCDWQLPIGQMPFYEILLPDAQQSRSYARILAVKARIAIANGNFDEAIKTFQTNCALGRNVAQGETLVNGLIGIAINGIMVPQLNEYVQQPAAPNLYWALTTLPSPLINMNEAVDVESNALELSFPELRDLATAQRSPDEWRRVTHRIAMEITKSFATANRPIQSKSPEEIDKICELLAPLGKTSLIDSGMTAEKVEAMSVHQAALLYALRTCHKVFDEAAKCYSLPYPESLKAIKASRKLANIPTHETREILPLMQQATDALEATRIAIARNDRHIAVLRMIETLRIYAAAHDGKLPNQLADISEVPIPNDPVTMKPFEYRRDGDKAFVQGLELPGAPLSYEITMAAVK